MHVGMLWFDDNPNLALKSRIEKAVAYYRKKYQCEPNLCLIHPSMIEKDKPEFESMTVRSYRPVLPGHFWIGIEEKN